jgi:colicin import membrane protein
LATFNQYPAKLAASLQQAQQQLSQAQSIAGQRDGERVAAEKVAAEKAAAKAKAEAEAKAKAEAERAAAAKAKAEAEAKAAQEAARAKAAASQEAINNAIKAIRLKVNRSWIRPISTKSGLKCRIRVRLMSDGTVIEAEVISSSGDEIFDRSAENAVNKASPLPVPQDKELFAKSFRSFTFTFDPDRGG